jgi:uncharacterized protein YegP (UPF0339 family)
MYNHEVTKTEQGKYQMTIYAPNGTPVFQKEYDHERQARNGTIEFMYNGPNLVPDYLGTVGRTKGKGKADDTDKSIERVSPRDYLGYSK